MVEKHKIVFPNDETVIMPIDSAAVLYSNGSNDECYTPRYGVEPIAKFVPDGSIVWCPFDTEDSEFVKVLREAGHTVVSSHISE